MKTALHRIDALLESLRKKIVKEDFETSVKYAKDLIGKAQKSFGGTFNQMPDDTRLMRAATVALKHHHDTQQNLTDAEWRQARDLYAKHFRLDPEKLNAAMEKIGSEGEHLPKSKSFSSPEELTKAMMLRHHATSKGLHPGASMDRMKPAPASPGKNKYDDKGNHNPAYPETGNVAEKPFPTDKMGKVGGFIEDYMKGLTPKKVSGQTIHKFLETIHDADGTLRPLDLKPFGDYMRAHTSKAFMRRAVRGGLEGIYGERDFLEGALKRLKAGQDSVSLEQLHWLDNTALAVHNLGFDLDDVYPELHQYHLAAPNHLQK